MIMSLNGESLQQQQHIVPTIENIPNINNTNPPTNSLNTSANNIDISQYLRVSHSSLQIPTSVASIETNKSVYGLQKSSGGLNISGITNLDEQILSYLVSRSGEKGFANLAAGVVDGNRNFVKWLTGVDESQIQIDMNDEQRICEAPVVGSTIAFVPQIPDTQLDAQLSIPMTPVPHTKRRASSASGDSNHGTGHRRKNNVNNSFAGDSSMEEEKAVKKKRRQEKNREAAQLFRQRQKQRVHDLEKKVEELSVSNNEYRTKVEILSFENRILRDQLTYLRNLIASGIVIPNANLQAMASMPQDANVDKKLVQV
jgi:hypothetical protein